MIVDDAQSMDIRASDGVIGAEDRLADLMDRFPGDARQRLHQLPLFLPPHTFRRMLFMGELYRRILDVHGSILEFGVRFGRDLATFDALRTVHEPLNHARRIVGFDTFTGFPEVSPEDGDYGLCAPGALTTGDGYEGYLSEVLATREGMAPFEHIRRFEVVRGDATETLPAFLADNPHTIVALAYFDMDIYAPTRACLELVMQRVTRGSVIGFDQLDCPAFPGETLAVMETVGLSRYRIQRMPGTGPGMPSFIVID